MGWDSIAIHGSSAALCNDPAIELDLTLDYPLPMSRISNPRVSRLKATHLPGTIASDADVNLWVCPDYRYRQSSLFRYKEKAVRLSRLVPHLYLLHFSLRREARPVAILRDTRACDQRSITPPSPPLYF